MLWRNFIRQIKSATSDQDNRIGIMGSSSLSFPPTLKPAVAKEENVPTYHQLGPRA